MRASGVPGGSDGDWWGSGQLRLAAWGSVGKLSRAAWLYIGVVIAAAAAVVAIGPFGGLDWVQVGALGLLLVACESSPPPC